MTMSSRQTWWVAVKQPDGTEAEPEVAQVWFKDADQVEEVLRLGDERGLRPDQVRLIERVLPPGRALTIEAICDAFEESGKNDRIPHIGRLQVEDEDWEGEPTGRRAYTLVDGYVDLQRVVEILNFGEPQS